MNQTGIFIFVAVVIAFTIAGLMPGTKYSVDEAFNAQPFTPTQIETNNSSPEKNLQINSFSPKGQYSCQANSKAAVELLIDTSGSMKDISANGKSRMDNVKDAVKSFVNNFKADDVIGIQTFSGGGGKRDTEPIVLSKYSDVSSQITQAIDGMSPQGGTPTKQGFGEARKNIQEAKAKFPDYNWNLVVLSDGEPNPYPEEDPRAIAKDIDQVDKVHISTIALELQSKDISLAEARQIMLESASSPADFYEPQVNQLTDVYNKIFQRAGSCTPPPAIQACVPSKKAIDLLVDTSGSMEENIPYLKTALKNFGSNLNSNLVVGMQDFSDGEPPRNAPARQKLAIGRFDQASFNRAVDLLPADKNNGWTMMKDGFLFAESKIDSNSLVKNYSDWLMIFLSDGKPETDGSNGGFDSSQDPSSIVNDLKNKRMEIVTVALGNKADRGLMQKLASNGQYKVAQDGTELQQVYQDIYQNSLCGK